MEIEGTNERDKRTEDTYNRDSLDKPKIEPTQRGYWDKPHIERREPKKLGLWEGLKLGHQATASLTAHDFAQLGTYVDQVFDPDFKPTETVEFKAFREVEMDHETVLKVIHRSLNYDHMRALIARTQAVREAQHAVAESDSPMLYSLLGGFWSPELFIPVLGSTSKVWSAHKLLKIAETSRKARVSMVVNDVVKNAALTGDLAVIRAASDTTYNKHDAMIDTLLVSAFTGVLSTVHTTHLVGKGRRLAEKMREAASVRATAMRANMQAKSAHTVKGALETSIIDNRLAALKTQPVPVAQRNLSIKELNTLISHKLSSSEYRELMKQVNKTVHSEQLADFLQSGTSSQHKHTGDLSPTLSTEQETLVLKTRLQRQIDAIEAEAVMLKRRDGLADDLPLEDIGRAKHTGMSKDISKGLSLMSKRAALDNAELPEGYRKALHDNYQATLKTSYDELRGQLAQANTSLSDAVETLRVSSLNNQIKQDTTQRGAAHAWSGLKRGKLTPLLQSTVGYLNDYQRGMRSSNEAYRNLFSDLLHNSSEGGRSVASVAENNFEDMIKSLDRASRKDTATFIKEFRTKHKGSSSEDAFAHVTDMVEGYVKPTTLAEKAMLKHYREFMRDSVERLHMYNPNYKVVTNDTYMPHLVDAESISKYYKLGKNTQMYKTIVRAIERGLKKAQWTELVERYGEEDAESLIRASARGYWEKLKKVADIQEDIQQRELTNIIRDNEFVDDIRIDELDIADKALVGRLSGDKKKGTTNSLDRLKSRLRIHLDVEVDGFNLKSLFQRDARTLALRYARDLSSWMGFAAKGYFTPADLVKAINKITVDGKTTRNSDVKDIERIRQYISLIKGIPLHKDTSTNAAVTAMMNAQFILRMGAAPIIGLAEYGRVLVMTEMSAIRQIPFFSQLSRRVSTMNDVELRQMGDDIQSILPHQYQPSRYFSTRVKSEDRTAHRLSMFSREVADVWGRVNLMEQVDRNVRGAAIDTFHNKLVGHLVDGKSLGKLIDFQYLGIDDAFSVKLRALLRRTTTVRDGTFGSIYSVDFSRWDKADMYRYKEVLYQAGNRLIQKTYLGEGTGATAPPLLRMFLQFRSFGLSSIGKQFGADIAVAEREGLSGFADLSYSWLLMSITTMLGIEARSRIINAGHPDFEERVHQQTTGRDAIATMWRYHPALGWTRDAVDALATIGIGVNLFEEEEYNEWLGNVQRSSKLKNTGLVESTPVGSWLTDTVKFTSEPDMQKFLRVAMPDAYFTRYLQNLMKE
ncbi:hypothetical protein [Candidatus Enterovibrio escicola]|uniref:hypothetical protein n=1 Tax=Candidatus Enterovibrio escicola TaxID=1927127 RepID=UPI001237CE84|nr:hypothetical protein [Candidatus Enterovibrio escacola]